MRFATNNVSSIMQVKRRSAKIRKHPRGNKFWRKTSFSVRNENRNENSGQGESVFERDRCHYRVSIVVMQRRNTLDLRRDPVVQGSIGINGPMGIVTCLLFRAQRVSRAPEADTNRLIRSRSARLTNASSKVEILCRRGGRGDTVSVQPHHQGIGYAW